MPSFDTPAPVTLSIELDAGNVVIDATTTTSTEIELRPLNAGDADAAALIDRAEITHDGDKVTVHLPTGKSGLFRRTPEIVISARLPVGSTLTARLRSADLRVTGELDHVRVESASGDVNLPDVAGSAVVITASGDARLGTVGGPVELKTASGSVGIEVCCANCSIVSASGDVTLGLVEGDLSLKTASGDVTVRAADGAVRARTASGDVAIKQVRTGIVEIDTVSGGVQLGVERGVSVWLDVSSLSGKVRSRLELSDGASDDDKSLELRVRTLSGDVSLQPV
jgi:DUF4097 and DUF4098 domain-containing protein YvlB